MSHLIQIHMRNALCLQKKTQMDQTKNAEKITFVSIGCSSIHLLNTNCGVLKKLPYFNKILKPSHCNQLSGFKNHRNFKLIEIVL